MRACVCMTSCICQNQIHSSQSACEINRPVRTHAIRYQRQFFALYFKVLKCYTHARVSRVYVCVMGIGACRTNKKCRTLFSINRCSACHEIESDTMRAQAVPHELVRLFAYLLRISQCMNATNASVDGIVSVQRPAAT